MSDGFSRELWSLVHPSDQDPHPKMEKNKCVLNWLLGKIQCFKTMFCFVFLSGKSPVADPPLFFFEPFPYFWFKHSWQFVIIPSAGSIFKLAKFKLEYWSGLFQDAVSILSSTLPLLSMTMRTIGRWSLVDFLPDAGQGVGSFQVVCEGEGVLIRLGMCGESSTLIFYRKNVFNGTLWKEKTFSCSMTRNIIYSFIGLSVSRAPSQTCQPSFYLASITSLV